jgi:endonuclease/exonuclease/phosphatase family metal-dependent hydrolase
MGALSTAARLACISLLLLTPAAAAQTEPHSSARRTLKLATWNLEWLIAPEVFRSMRESCAPKSTPVRGAQRRLPCDVALRFDRSSSDFHALARYAKQLNADVIALQEVDGPAAAALVFEGYRFCFSARRHVQNTGFAIRPGIPHRCGQDLQTLSLNDSLRRGAELIVYPGERHEVRLLSVHLKSGCNRGTLDANKDACRDLSRQVPLLEAWIDAQSRAGRRFAILGDFNRDLLRDASGPAHSSAGRLLRLWPEIDDGDPPESDLRNAAEGQRFIGCAPGQRYKSYIDSIVLSRTLGASVVPGSFFRVTYQAPEATRLKLSDHCPVSVTVGL